MAFPEPRATTLLALVALVLATGAVPGAATADEPAAAELVDAALLVIDIQEFYFPGGMMPLEDAQAAAANAARLLECFRASKRPVIHVQHLPRGVERPDPVGVAEQYRIHHKVLPSAGETVVGKHHANAFRDTQLDSILKKLGVKRLVVAGMQTHMCVEAAVRAAADLGYEVTVVHDACATRALEFGGEQVPAPQVHAAALAAMQSSYARVVSTAELCGERDGDERGDNS